MTNKEVKSQQEEQDQEEQEQKKQEQEAQKREKNQKDNRDRQDRQAHQNKRDRENAVGETAAHTMNEKRSGTIEANAKYMHNRNELKSDTRDAITRSQMTPISRLLMKLAKGRPDSTDPSMRTLKDITISEITNPHNLDKALEQIQEIITQYRELVQAQMRLTRISEQEHEKADRVREEEQINQMREGTRHGIMGAVAGFNRAAAKTAQDIIESSSEETKIHAQRNSMNETQNAADAAAEQRAAIEKALSERGR